MSPTKTLFLVLLVLLVTLYVQSYLRPKNDYTIVQTYLDKISVDALYDKHPIVIYDLIKDPRSLLTSLFSYSFQFDTYTFLEPNRVMPAKAKYTLVYNDNLDASIHLISPKHLIDSSKPLEQQADSVQYVTVNLKQHQVIIVPMKWHISSPANPPCKVISLDDFLSATLKLINVI